MVLLDQIDNYNKNIILIELYFVKNKKVLLL